MTLNADHPLTQRWTEISSIQQSFPATRLEMLRAFVRDFPGFEYGWSNLGAIACDLSLLDEGETALRKAMDLMSSKEHPGLAFVFHRLGTLFRRKGQRQQAESWFRRSIEQNPDDAAGYIFWGAMLASLGDTEQAGELYRRAT